MKLTTYHFCNLESSRYGAVSYWIYLYSPSRKVFNISRVGFYGGLSDLL